MSERWEELIDDAVRNQSPWAKDPVRVELAKRAAEAERLLALLANHVSLAIAKVDYMEVFRKGCIEATKTALRHLGMEKNPVHAWAKKKPAALKEER